MMQHRIDSLDVLRALCALGVLAAHLFGETEGLGSHPLLTGLASFGVESVIGFFVLSGCVIALQPYAGQAPYLRARAVRILPIYYIVLAGCIALMLWTREPFKATELLGNLFFVQNLFWRPVRPLDFFFSSWSLNYELYYYLGFLLVMARPRLLLPFATISLLTGIGLYWLPHQGPHMLVLHPLSLWCLWLVGAWIAGRVDRGAAAPSLATAAWVMALAICLSRLPWNFSEENKFDFGRLLGFGIGFAAVAWALLDTERRRTAPTAPAPIEVGLPLRLALTAGVLALLWSRSHSFVTTKIEIAAVVVAATIVPGAVVVLVAWGLRPLLPSLRYVSGLSYGLYLVHYPVLQFSNRVAVDVSPYLRIAGVAALSFGLAHLLEYRLQPWLRRRLRPTPAPTPSAATS